MSNSVFIIAIAKPDAADLNSVWNAWVENRKNFVDNGFVYKPPQYDTRHPGKDWTVVEVENHFDTKVKKDFVWQEDLHREPFLFYSGKRSLHYWQRDLKGKKFCSVGGIDEWRPFHLHAGKVRLDTNDDTNTIRIKDDKKFEDIEDTDFWVNPIVLHVSLYETDKNLIEFSNKLLNDRSYEIKIIPDWEESDCCRYLCKKILRERHQKHRYLLPDSIVRRIYFSKGDSDDSSLFEILDSMGGRFYVDDFGSSQEPKISFCPPTIDKQSIASTIAQYVCEKLGFKLKNVEIPVSLPPPRGQREMNVDIDIDDEDIDKWDSIFAAIHKRYGYNYGIWEQPLCFINSFRRQNKTVSEQFNALLPSKSGTFDVIHFINRFAELFVLPRSPLLFRFPQGEFINEDKNNSKSYDEFRERWSFDMIDSLPEGAGTFFRRLLNTTDTETITGPDTRHKFMWEYAWYDALWFCNQSVHFKISDKGKSSRLGSFRIGYSCLSEKEDLLDDVQLSQILFAPVVR